MSRYLISDVLPGLLFILSSPPLHAENADRDKPLHLESDSVSIDDVKQVSVFEGVVELAQGTLTIHADKIVVKQNKLGYKHCTATGKTDQLPPETRRRGRVCGRLRRAHRV